MEDRWNLKDGCGHIMGGCSHPTMHAIYMSRHDSANYITADCIRKSRTGRWLLVADLGQEKRRQLQDNCNEIPNKVPKYLLPTLSDEQRNAFRPDILYHRFVDETGGPSWPNPEHPVTIIEIGYCRDTAFDEKREEKRLQHKKLREALEKWGWPVNYVIVTLGHCGAVFKKDMQALQAATGMTNDEVKNLFSKLHDNAVTHTCGAAWKHTELRRLELQRRGIVEYPPRQPKPPRPP
jgi:hypothetical protein